METEQELFEWSGLPEKEKEIQPRLMARFNEVLLRDKLKDLDDVSSGVAALTRIAKEMIYASEDSEEPLNTNRVCGLLISIEQLTKNADWTLEHLDKTFKFR